MRNRLVSVAVCSAISVVMMFAGWRFQDLGRVGTGYAAEVTCACMFVSGRAQESCRGDLDPLARKLISVTVGSDDVRTSALGLAHARARFDAATGCTLVE